MPTIDDVLKNFQSVDLEKELPLIVSRHDQFIVDLNKDQLEQGMTSDNKSIKPGYRNKGYAAYKNELSKSPGYGTPDLKLTGAFYAGFRVYFKAFTYSLLSIDSKSQELQDRYSKNGDIFGLTDDNKEALSQEVIPDVFKYISSKTGLPKGA